MTNEYKDISNNIAVKWSMNMYDENKEKGYEMTYFCNNNVLSD